MSVIPFVISPMTKTLVKRSTGDCVLTHETTFGSGGCLINSESTLVSTRYRTSLGVAKTCGRGRAVRTQHHAQNPAHVQIRRPTTRPRRRPRREVSFA